MRNTLTQSGFTLIEVLVSISIVSVIMLVTLWNYGTFLDNLALSAAGQEIATAIRQAQVYGLSVKEVSVGGGQFNYAYGVHFDMNDPSHYIIFVDKNTVPNKIYDAGAGCGSGIGNTECIEQGTLENGVTVSSVGHHSCSSSNIRIMDITFLRPNPDAVINSTDSGGSILCASQFDGEITLTSPNGNTEVITVQSTGQISLQ
jgi:prepilin-type N-terminal cleavage/methylation domain-containing protein